MLLLYWLLEHPLQDAIGYLVIAVLGVYIASWFTRASVRHQGEHWTLLLWPIMLLIVTFFGIWVVIEWVFAQIDRQIARALLVRVQSDSAGELYRGPVKGSADAFQALVKVRDHTGDHWIRVPPNTATAQEGVAWSYGLRASEYQPVLRT